MKIALISCSKKKRPYRCAAYELYAPSLLFSLSYQYAKQHTDKIYILSSQYGLLAETDIIDTYELDLKDLSIQRQRAWANDILRKLKENCNIQDDEFMILAGKSYYQYFVPYLPHFSLPLDHMSINARICFLKQQLNQVSFRP